MGTSLIGKREEARENIKAAQAKQKEKYDIKHAPPSYKVGDKVLKFNRRRDTRMGDKLAPRFTGPYEIFEVLVKGVYRLKDGDKVMKQVVNAINLKIWHESQGSPVMSQKKEMPKLHEESDSDHRGGERHNDFRFKACRVQVICGCTDI